MVLGSLVLLWDYSSPSSNLYWWLAGVAIVALSTVAWLLRANTWADVRRDWLWIPPLAFALVIGLIATDIPLRLRWHHSQSAFTEATHTDISSWCGGADFDERLVRRRLGSYSVSCDRAVGEAVMFSTGTDGLFSVAGFAHLPNGEVPGLGGCTTFEHLRIHGRGPPRGMRIGVGSG